MTEWKTASAGETEAQFRQFLSYLFTQVSSGFASTGVVSGLGVAQTATASGSVVVGRGMAVVQSSLTAGAAPLVSNADKTIDILTGSPMGGLARNDLIIFNADTAAIEAVIGTPNAAPTDPNVSANHIKLARVRNAANATSIPNSAIDDLRTYTRVGNTPYAMSSGYYQHTGTILSTAAVGPFPITFPAGRFTVAPNVQLSINEGSRLVAYATSVTKDGFNLYLRNVSASDSPANSDNVTWTAVQMTANSANG